jgi:hypothetical protein
MISKSSQRLTPRDCSAVEGNLAYKMASVYLEGRRDTEEEELLNQSRGDVARRRELVQSIREIQEEPGSL